MIEKEYFGEGKNIELKEKFQVIMKDFLRILLHFQIVLVEK